MVRGVNRAERCDDEPSYKSAQRKTKTKLKERANIKRDARKVGDRKTKTKTKSQKEGKKERIDLYLRNAGWLEKK